MFHPKFCLAKPNNNLRNNQFIVINPCDKGGDICIMNTRDYLTKIHTHLQDHNTYKALTQNPTSAIANNACSLLEYMHSQLIIDKATKQFYYLLRIPVHLSSLFLVDVNWHFIIIKSYIKVNFKEINNKNNLWTTQSSQARLPPPPYCFWKDDPTDHLSAYITHFIQPLTSNRSSHIKTQNIFSTLLKIFHLSHPMPPWSQLTSHP